MADGIGTYNEQPLHSALKDVYANRGGRKEVVVDGYIIDVVRDQQLIEIQTQHFYAIKKKIFELINNYFLKLVYPIASEKWLLKLPKAKGGTNSRRKSPKRGRPLEIFRELVSIPEMIKRPNFTLDVVMADIEEVRRYTGKKPWRQNGWETVEQRLIRVVKVITIHKPEDLMIFLPESLPGRFTSADLQKAAEIPRWLAQKTAYCLKQSGVVKQMGKRGRYNLYEQNS